MRSILAALLLALALPAQTNLGGGCPNHWQQVPSLGAILGQNLSAPSLIVWADDERDWLVLCVDVTNYWPSTGVPLQSAGLGIGCTLMVWPHWTIFASAGTGWSTMLPIPAGLHGIAKLQAFVGDSFAVGGVCLTDALSIAF